METKAIETARALLADASPELPENKTGSEAPFVTGKQQNQEELENNLRKAENALRELIEGGKR
jgi:hypothetical protein